MRFIKQQLREGGIETLLFTCDTPSLTLDWGNVDNELMAINFQWEAELEIEVDKFTSLEGEWPNLHYEMS